MFGALGFFLSSRHRRHETQQLQPFPPFSLFLPLSNSRKADRPVSRAGRAACWQFRYCRLSFIKRGMESSSRIPFHWCLIDLSRFSVPVFLSTLISYITYQRPLRSHFFESFLLTESACFLVKIDDINIFVNSIFLATTYFDVKFLSNDGYVHESG
jgi:hypothetical protein